MWNYLRYSRVSEYLPTYLSTIRLVDSAFRLRASQSPALQGINLRRLGEVSPRKIS